MIRMENNTTSMLKGVLVAYIILILHVLLIVCLGTLVLFFRGVVTYMAWIFLIGFFINFLLVVYFYRKIKKRNSANGSVFCDPRFGGQAVEVNLFRGLVSFKMDSSLFEIEDTTKVDTELSQLELYEPSKTHEITKLAKLLEEKLITLDEYNEAKRDIFSVLTQ